MLDPTTSFEQRKKRSDFHPSYEREEKLSVRFWIGSGDTAVCSWFLVRSSGHKHSFLYSFEKLD